MHRVFLPIFHFFHHHKVLMYVVMAASFVLFAFFGLKMNYEEDIFSLMPESSVESQFAFGSIGLKDKVYIQVESEDECSANWELMDEFVERLQMADSSTGYIANILCRIDAETGLNALDFVLEHLPSFVDTSAYADFTEALEPATVQERMAENYELLMADETGATTQMIANDPLWLREAILGNMMDGVMSSYTLVDSHFFCKDSTVALAWVAPAFPSSDSKTATKFAKMLQRCTKEFEADHPGVKLHAHGAPLASVSNASRIKSDLILTVGISLVLILIVIGFFFRSAAFLWKQLLPFLYGTIFALACIYWIQGGMSLMALGISVIVLGVALSYCLHITIHHFFTGDAEQMLRDESSPVFFGCLTTVGAFCSLLFTESSLLRDFGLFASLALVGSTMYALVFLPHFLPRRRTDADSPAFRGVLQLNNMPFDRKPWLLITLTIIMLVGIVFAPRVKFDSDLRNLNYRRPELTEAENLFNAKNNDGFTHLYYATVSADLDEAIEANKRLMPILDSLSQRGLVHSYNDMVPKLFVSEREQQRRIDAWNAFWTDSRKAEAMALIGKNARAMGIDPDMFGDFEALLDADYEAASLLESGVVPAELLGNFIERHPDGQYMVFTDVAMNKADKDSVTNAVLASPKTFVLEPFYYCKSMVEVIHDDFNVAVWISSIFVFIILIFSFYNILTALLSFLPMVISWFMVQGYMALFGIEFNLVNIVISTFIFGVGVDYSIFITEGLLAQARTGDDRMLSWHKVAIFFSAAILVIVVASLLFAVHPAISSIGLITLIGMASTIMISYSLQPFAFRMLMKIPAYRRSVLKEKKTNDTK
ncbi:MAG: MMPL family transporter [Bacteroidales bacterium]|nr:MMPL family transporter [Bacteroidales bacterium]